MTSISKKICLLGDFAVGKTSTVARSIRNTFSESYLTTVGVKVDGRNIQLDEEREVRLVLWDISGANSLDQMRANYIGGSQCALLVADGTRSETVETALGLREQAMKLLGRELPAVLILNKCDLVADWEISADKINELSQILPIYSASAKTGQGVEEALVRVAEMVMP